MAEETLGERIRRLRTERGLSLAKVAREDFSRAFLNQVELGRTRPSTRNLAVIAGRLGTGVDYLIAGESPLLDHELSLERARILVARGRPRPALAELEKLADLTEWPLAVDARITAARAYLALGDGAAARQVLEGQLGRARAEGDEDRARLIRSLRAGRGAAPSDPAAQAADHARLGDRLLRLGRPALALEHYRVARTLFEALAAPLR